MGDGRKQPAFGKQRHRAAIGGEQVCRAIDSARNLQTRAGVAVEMHRFASGGHGFAMGRPGTPTLAWPGFYEAWLRRRGFVA